MQSYTRDNRKKDTLFKAVVIVLVLAFTAIAATIPYAKSRITLEPDVLDVLVKNGVVKIDGNVVKLNRKNTIHNAEISGIPIISKQSKKKTDVNLTSVKLIPAGKSISATDKEYADLLEEIKKLQENKK